MINIPFMEKIQKFFEIIAKNNYAFIVVGLLLVLSFILLFACRKNDKLTKTLYFILYGIAIIGILLQYHTYLLSLIDYLIENIVANLLFPNLAIYMGILLIINIIVIRSIFSNKVKFYVKSINVVCFIIMQLFLYLIINNVIANNVNVYEKLSIYTNQELLLLVELSMQIFVVWLFVLGFIRLIDYLMDKSVSIKKVDTEIIISNEYDDDNNDIPKLIEYAPIKKVQKSN